MNRFIVAAVLFAFSGTVNALQVQRPPADSGARGAIEGLVVYPPDTPATNVTILARETGTPGSTTGGAVSDLNGRFRIERLPAGRFSLEVTRGAESLATLPPLDLAEGETRVIRIDLRVPSTERVLTPQRPGEIVPIVPPGAATGQPAEQRGLDRPQAATLTVIATLPPGAEFIPMDRRWRTLSAWNRYPADPSGDYPYVRGRWWDPYNQNKLKGDYPIFGRRWFLSLSAASDTQFEGRRVPVVRPPSSSQADDGEFFGRGEQFQFAENLVFSAELFRGVTVFRPFDVRFRVTPAFNWNYLHTRENAAVNIDVREGTTRWDRHAAIQEAFAEVRLAEVSRAFDAVTLRAGTQFFNSDFRGFIFFDNEPGVRLFGTFGANRHQYNLAYFEMVEKDTNSTLNTFRARHQSVGIANYYIQDFLVPGYTTEFSIHYNNDRPSFHLNENDFLERPEPAGSVELKSINAVYFGWAGDGHFGRLNVNHAAYQVLGRERPNPLAGDVFGSPNTRIDARMAALELSMDRDWLRYKISGFYASGDNDIRDDRARGFDSIFDNVVFGGGPLSFWNRQDIRLSGTGLGLNQRFSLVPSLRTSRDEGQANFVNPGLMMFTAGADAELTPKLRASATASYLSFSHTNVLEALLFQPNIRRSIGADLGVGVTWRPFLNNNVVIRGGASTLLPGAGFRQIYTPQALLSSFVEVRVAY